MTTRCPNCGWRITPPELRRPPQSLRTPAPGYGRPVAFAWALVIVIGFSAWALVALYFWRWFLAPG